MTRIRSEVIFVLLPLLAAACGGSAVVPSDTQSSAETAQAHVADPAESSPAAPTIAARPVCVDTEGRYKVIEDFVIDHANGARVWQRYVPEPLFTQAEAAAYCARVTLGRQTIWRLPSAAELVSIQLNPAGLKAGPQTCDPAIDQVAFPGTPATPFWSSTTRISNDSVEGISVAFDDGRSHPTSPDTKLNVRCVTDP